MILFRRADAALVNALLAEWGHYLGPQAGPRLVLWYVLTLKSVPVAVAVSGTPRGATCALVPWPNVVECARICTAPGHNDLTRVVLRCWRKVAAQDFADAYGHPISLLAAYSDSSRHPGSIYRTDGWKLYDERQRGSGGTATRGGSAQRRALKRLWVWRVEPAVTPRQMRLEGTA